MLHSSEVNIFYLTLPASIVNCKVQIMREPIIRVIPSVLSSYVSGTEFQFPDNIWKEPCGQIAHLIADSGTGKGQLGLLVEACNRDNVEVYLYFKAADENTQATGYSDSIYLGSLSV